MVNSTYTCAVCNHSKRSEIEDALMNRSWGVEHKSIADIAKEFGVTTRQLQVHAVLHVPAIKLELEEGQDADEALQNKELDFLRNTMIDNYTLMKALQKRIMGMVDDASPDAMRPLSRNMTDLYLGCSKEIRDAVEALGEVRQINTGDTDTAMSGMMQLVRTINDANVARAKLAIVPQKAVDAG